MNAGTSYTPQAQYVRVLSLQVYGGEARLSSLRKLFPLVDDKKSLSSEEERAKVEGKASLLAAIDYFVSMQSDVFISASPGNMHNALVIFFLPDPDVK